MGEYSYDNAGIPGHLNCISVGKTFDLQKFKRYTFLMINFNVNFTDILTSSRFTSNKIIEEIKEPLEWNKNY
jgi:hypothetical protein